MTLTIAFHSRIDVSEYESFIMADGAPAGDVAWMRSTEREGRTHKVGMWQCGKSGGVPYLFAADETFAMMEGILEIKLEDGTTWVFEPGDTGSFLKDTNSTWTVKEPVLHFIIQTT